MRVCVVGAGPSGLTTIKQLLDEGHDVTCYDKNADIGGIWYRHDSDSGEMKVYDDMMLTISMKLMCFSDFMWEGERVFSDHEGYLRYLEQYTAKFNLRKTITFNTEVNAVIHNDDSSWSVAATKEGRKEKLNFDAVALCVGAFQTPNNNLPELRQFSGSVIHSSAYRNGEEFTGKNVLVVGFSESGADIVRQVSNVASKCVLSIRSYTLLLPRLPYGKYATDMMTWRALHYEVWIRAAKAPFPGWKAFWSNNRLSRGIFMTIMGILGMFALIPSLLSSLFQFGKRSEVSMNKLGQPLYPQKMDLDTGATRENVAAINNWNEKSHNGNGYWIPKMFFCKNVSFIPNLVNGKISVNDTGIERAEGRRIYFKDGTSNEFDTVVLCTGFVNDYSVLSNVEVRDNNIRNFYRHAFHPDYAGRLAVIGLVRPFSGGVPICAEMQARYFSLLCSNSLSLPPNLEERIQQDKMWEEELTALRPNQYETVPSQIMFLDSIAREIGCFLPMSSLIYKPRLFAKLWLYSFNQACYRLVGPHSSYEDSVRHIMEEKIPAEKSIHLLMPIFSLLPYFIHPKNLPLAPMPRRQAKTTRSQ